MIPMYVLLLKNISQNTLREIGLDFNCINVCFVVEKHKSKYLKRNWTRFQLLHRFEFNSELWQVCMDEGRVHVLILIRFVIPTDDELLIASST